MIFTEQENDLISQGKLVPVESDGAISNRFAPYVVVSVNMDGIPNSTHMYKKWLRLLWNWENKKYDD